MLTSKRIPTSNNQLDSLFAFRYLYWIWRLIGLYPPEERKLRWLYYVYSAFIMFTFYICLPISQLAKFSVVDKWEDIILNMSVVTSFITSSCKFFAILGCRHYLLEVAVPLRELDKRSNGHETDRGHINDAVRLCHLYCLIYMIFYNFVGFGYAYIYWMDHDLIGWFPTIFANERLNYLFAFWSFLIAQTYAVIQNVNNDIYPVCHLIVMVGQQRALRDRISRVGHNRSMDVKANNKELIQCMHDFNHLLKYFECIQRPISRTIFLQFLVMALVLCLNAINFMFFDHDVAQMLITGAYLFSILIEVFPCCWYVNEMMEQSASLTTSLYYSNWYEQDQRFRKTLIIFMLRSHKTIELLAGNIAPVTLQTFIAVVRFSFSVYTLLNEMHG